jgi:hypothetical protein
MDCRVKPGNDGVEMGKGLSRVPDAVQRHTASKTRVKRAYGGAPLIRDRHGLERSRVCSAPLTSLVLRWDT